MPMRLSKNYQDLTQIKEQLAFSLEESHKLLECLVAQKAAHAHAHGSILGGDIDSDAATATSKDTPEISVIVPVLNTAPYLRKCLDSLVGQTFKNIEIICVDDGSTDESLSILKEYAAADSRIIVISQAHLGVSAARNAALQRARAPYLMSCDSDDWFDTDMCHAMLATLKREKVDVVVCGMSVVFDVPEELRENVTEYLRLKYFGKQTITQELVLVTDVSLCNKIYKKSIVDKHGIDFPEGLLFEDAYFNDVYMTAAETIYFLHQPLYNYLRHGASVMSTSYKKSGTSFDYLQIAFKTWDYLEREDLLTSYCEYYWQRFFQYASFALKHLSGSEKKKAKRMARAFVKEQRDNLAGAGVRTRYRVKILLNTRSKVLYRMYRLPKWFYAKVSVSRAVRFEIMDLTKKYEGVQAQIKEMLNQHTVSMGAQGHGMNNTAESQEVTK